MSLLNLGRGPDPDPEPLDPLLGILGALTYGPYQEVRGLLGRLGRWGRDNPADAAQLAGEMAVDVSRLGPAKAMVYDAPRDLMEGRPGMAAFNFGTGLLELAVTPAALAIGGLKYIDEANDLAKASDEAIEGVADAVVESTQGFSPEFLRDNYPTPAPPVTRFDKKKGKEFQSRGTDAANDEFHEARKRAQQDIEAGNYDPVFPESERYYANPENYAIDADRSTSELIPKRQDTIDRKIAEWDTPEIRQRLHDAIDLGSMDPDAMDWYAMGQLEDAAIAELGQEAGTQWFRQKFAEAMASTTAGQNPTSNLMMAAYSNYRNRRGLPIPLSHDVPRPVQGSYMTNNLTAGEKVLQEGLPPTSPKGFSFSRNFMGDLSRGTMDAQMTQGATASSLSAPPNNAYPFFEGVMADVASQRGLQTANAQDVAWAGFKVAKDQKMNPRQMLDAIEAGAEAPRFGFPMIRHVNHALERTARLTGQTPQQVLRRWIREDAPLFSGAGLLGAGALGGYWARKQYGDRESG